MDLVEDTDGEMGGIDNVQVYRRKPVDPSEYKLSDAPTGHRHGVLAVRAVARYGG
jgi:hypothetical protein